MSKRKYPPPPEIEALERVMNRRDELKQENQRLRERIAELEATLDGIRWDPNWIVDYKEREP